MFCQQFAKAAIREAQEILAEAVAGRGGPGKVEGVAGDTERGAEGLQMGGLPVLATSLGQHTQKPAAMLLAPCGQGSVCSRPAGARSTVRLQLQPVQKPGLALLGGLGSERWGSTLGPALECSQTSCELG